MVLRASGLVTNNCVGYRKFTNGDILTKTEKFIAHNEKILF
jgi:hypothetical protein